MVVFSSLFSEDSSEVLTLKLDGKPIGVREAGEPLAKVIVPEGVDPRRGRLTVALPSSCGTEDLPLAITSETRDDRHAVFADLSLRHKPITIRFDNTTGPATTVRVGTRVVQLPARSGDQRLSVSLGSCPEAKTIRVRDRAVGTIPEPGTESPPTLVVDVEGGHCYQLSQALYTLRGTSWVLEEILQDEITSEGLVKLGGGLHAVDWPDIESFLSAPAPTLPSDRAEQPSATRQLPRNVLARVPCQ